VKKIVVLQPNERISATQKCAFPAGLDDKETVSTGSNVAQEIPGTMEDEWDSARGLCRGGTLTCSVYRSISQLRKIHGE